MPNFAAMYKKLFNAQTDAIKILQVAQQETEEMYVSADPDVRLIDGGKKDEDSE